MQCKQTDFFTSADWRRKLLPG